MLHNAKNPIKLKTISLPDSWRSSGIAKSYLLKSNLYHIEDFDDLDVSNQRSTSDLMDKNPQLSTEIAMLQHLRTERTSDCVENLEYMDTIWDLDGLT